MRPSLRSTSTRTFLVWPVAVGLAHRAGAARRLRWARWALRGSPPTRARLVVGALPLAGGWLTYRACGRYRIVRAGGPPGMSQGMPDRLVTEGPYARSRNPMYAGHIAFLTGLAVTVRSPVAAVVAIGHLPWFARRVRRDEERLRARFGRAYQDYAARVPRWVSLRSASGGGNGPRRCPVKSYNGIMVSLVSRVWRGARAPSPGRAVLSTAETPGTVGPRRRVSTREDNKDAQERTQRASDADRSRNPDG